MINSQDIKRRNEEGEKMFTTKNVRGADGAIGSKMERFGKGSFD